jgi:hypothetical protein
VLGTLISTLLAALLAAPVSSGKDAPVIQDAPAWVTRAEPDLSASPHPAEAGEAREWLLSDEQLNTSAKEKYVHFAERVLSPEGISSAAHVDLQWNPVYQTLFLHRIRIYRDGKIRDEASSQKLKIVDLEAGATERMYDGRKTALLELEDVRVGDVVETSFTVRGANPIFEGRSGFTTTLGFDTKVRRLLRRVVLPDDRSWTRTLEANAPAPLETRQNGKLELLWDLRAPKLIEGMDEDRVPLWIPRAPEVWGSEFGSWPAVVAWALPLFRSPDPLPPELADLIAPWKKLPPKERLFAALRFARDDVRYVGVEIGVNAYLPHAPAEVVRKRYGDCKDKAFLLTTLLRALEIDASVALVSTRRMRRLDTLPPAPQLFNHAIVRARLEGKTLWLDATDPWARGGLDDYLSAPEERALVIETETTGLEVIPDFAAKQPTMELLETFDARNTANGVERTVVTHHRGPEANAWRRRMAESTLAELERAYLNFYVAQDADIVQSAPLQVADDPERNEVVVTEHYRLPTFWRDGERSFDAQELHRLLVHPKVKRRQHPFWIEQGFWGREEQRVLLPPDRGRHNTSHEHETCTALDYTFSEQATPSGLRMTHELRTTANEVEASQLADYQKTLDRIVGDLSRSYEQGDPLADTRDAGRQASDREFGYVVAGLFAAFVAIWGGWNGFGAARRRYRKRLRAKAIENLPGEVAAAPFDARTAGDVEARISASTCSCGGKLVRGKEVDEIGAILAGRKVWRAGLHCLRCQLPAARWYVLAGS